MQLSQLSDNLCLYYARLTDDIYQRLMDKALAAGHKGLKLSHALILPKLSAEGSRIIDIAKSQGVSKQAIGQLANELEKLGYIERFADPNDKRSKKLILTHRGINLVKQAASFMQDVEHELQEQMGQESFQFIHKHSHELFRKLELQYPEAGDFTPEVTFQIPLVAHAAALATELDLRLQKRNSDKGHPTLKRSYWQILERITQDGVRINDLAELNGISKQAISQLANEIEKAGYISRIDDPSDKRARKLILTEKGKQLVIDTIISTQAVERELQHRLGQTKLLELKQAFGNYLPQTPPIQREQAISPLKNALQHLIAQLPEEQRQYWLEDDEKGKKLSAKALQELAEIRLG